MTRRRWPGRPWRSSERIGDEFIRPFAISGLAAIAMERGEFERAATLVGAAEAIMEAQHMAWPPDERPHYERMLADLPEAMGSDAFDRAGARGSRCLRARPSTLSALALSVGTVILPDPGQRFITVRRGGTSGRRHRLLALGG